MKATGVVRRVDDLGRIVIPKEIRRTMHIREGEPMEIFTDSSGSVIFKKYSPMGDIVMLAEQMAQALSKETDRPCVICDRDSTVAGFGIKCEGRRLSRKVESIMENRRAYKGRVELWDEGPDSELLVPIIAEGDLCGCIALLENGREGGECDLKLAKMAAGFMASQMES